LDEKQLSLTLPKHDVYLTASLEEAGANHVLEALACGLPVVYRKGGGSINEYCEKYGIEYSSKDEMIKCIDQLKEYKFKKQYNRTIKEVVESYERMMSHHILSLLLMCYIIAMILLKNFRI
jgi:glycosyltransferase involved in cell wall biosynthesis